MTVQWRGDYGKQDVQREKQSGAGESVLYHTFGFDAAFAAANLTILRAYPYLIVFYRHCLLLFTDDEGRGMRWREGHKTRVPTSCTTQAGKHRKQKLKISRWSRGRETW